MDALGSPISDAALAHKSLNSAGCSGLVVTFLTAVHKILGLNTTTSSCVSQKQTLQYTVFTMGCSTLQQYLDQLIPLWTAK